MLQSVNNTVLIHVAERKQYLFTQINGEMPDSLIGDELLLACVLENIILNAAETIPPNGNITVDVSLVNETDAEVFLKISVEGMDGTGKHKQTENDESVIRDNTGLRIEIAKHIVKMLDGKWEDSVSENGSKYSFSLRFNK